MSLITSSSRATVAYFLAIFVLLGGLTSLQNHGVLAATDAQRSKVASARNVALDNAEFSWDIVRICVDSFDCTPTVDLTIASTFERTLLARMLSRASVCPSYSMCTSASFEK